MNGKILNVIKDIYSKAKSCVKSHQGLSRFFQSNIGVRQGENLSPILFSIFLNDLKSFLECTGYNLSLPLKHCNDLNMTDIENFVHLFLLLYADDTVILSESTEGMQKTLDAMKRFCENFGLNINAEKTKVMVFSRGKIRKLPVFMFEGKKLEIVWEYKYLGVVFSYNNKFTKAQMSQLAMANRAVFALLKKCRRLNLPLDIQLELFEKCVNPVLLYGCEIWSSGTSLACEKLQLKYLKMLSRVKRNTPNCMVFGELGIFPVSLEVMCRKLCFWYKLSASMFSGSSKLSVSLLHLCWKLYNHTPHKLNWLKDVHSMLNNLGLSYIWLERDSITFSVQYFKALVKKRMHDQYIQQWHQNLSENSICISYRIFKERFELEDYLCKLSPSDKKNMLFFRLSNHRLPIQSQRYYGVHREERLCPLCTKNDIGDEFHYLFCCPHPLIEENRKVMLPKYFQHHPNIIKMQQLFAKKSVKSLKQLSRFLGIILSLFK